MALKAVGFDIDGTLYPDYRARWHSLPFFFANILTVLAFSRTRHIMRFKHADSEIEEDAGEMELRYFAEQRGCSVEKARDIRDRILYKGWEKYFRGLKIYPEVRESLLRLKDAGLRLAVLSDFPVGRKLEYFGLEGIFDVILGFPESGGLKPRPEPFHIMAGKLGVDPAEILYIGNRLDYDVRGAENAGMSGALIGPPGRRAPAGVRVFSDYRQMAESILSEVVK